MRQIILDTETTGLDFNDGHRIIEVGCVELVSRRPTGRHFHRYINPERDIDEGAAAVHGIRRAQLEREPRFVEIASELLEFIDGAELIIHNASFDLGFLNAELRRLNAEAPPLEHRCAVLDTLMLAREMHPGQRNSLDALCNRYGVDNSKRDLHGALLDARILADVYLAMTGGQSALELRESANASGAASAGKTARFKRPSGVTLAVIRAEASELSDHEAMLERIAKASGGRVLFRA
jgi:DNA polymerase-3 subunit epsilon